MYKEGNSSDFAKCRKTQFGVNKMRGVMARSTQFAIVAMPDIRGISCYLRAPFYWGIR